MYATRFHIHKVCIAPTYLFMYNNINNNNNNNNMYLLQLVCNPVAVVMLHVYKT